VLLANGSSLRKTPKCKRESKTDSASGGARPADFVRTSFLKPAFESAIDVKSALGEKPHDAYSALSRILLEQNRYRRLMPQPPCYSPEPV
jgi:hypothetical protein